MLLAQFEPLMKRACDIADRCCRIGRDAITTSGWMPLDLVKKASPSLGRISLSLTSAFIGRLPGSFSAYRPYLMGVPS